MNVVIHRVPLHQSVVWPASRCPACGEPIRPIDNVPVLSYLLLRGRCRSCKARISARYPLVEALTGALFAAAADKFGLDLRLLSALVLISTLIALAGIDLEHRLLPNAIVGPAALAGLSLSILASPEKWWVYPAQPSPSRADCSRWPSPALVDGRGTSRWAVCSALSSDPYAALAVFLGAFAGAITGGLLMATGKIQRRHALPFGVFMALGGIPLFVGPQLWELYLGLARGVSGGF